MPSTQLSTTGIPTLPATATDCLMAGWFGSLTDGENFSPLANAGVAGVIFSIAASGANSDWSFEAWDTIGTRIMTFDVILPIDVSLPGIYHSFALTLDTTSQILRLLIDNVLRTFPNSAPEVLWSSAGPIGFLPDDPWVMGPVSPTTFTANTINFSDFRFHAGEGFDLSSVPNQRKLFTAVNTPVNWGANGENVTGIQPAVFLHGTSMNYAFNFGSGGVFTVTGVLSDAPEVCTGA